MPVKNACSEPLSPLFDKMDEMLMEDQRRVLQKLNTVPKVPPAAQLRTCGRCSVRLVARAAQLRRDSYRLCQARLR